MLTRRTGRISLPDEDAIKIKNADSELFAEVEANGLTCEEQGKQVCGTPFNAKSSRRTGDYKILDKSSKDTKNKNTKTKTVKELVIKDKT